MADTRIQLPRADYWEFRAALNEVGAIELKAMQAAAKLRQQVTDAEARTRALFDRLGQAHGFDPKQTYGWDDATCELIEVAADRGSQGP